MVSKRNCALHTLTNILMIVCVVTLLLGMLSIGTYAWSASDIRGKLWDQGGVSTASADDTLSANALIKYAKSGVFGDTCRSSVITETNNGQKMSINQILSADGCNKDLAKFYNEASAYAQIVTARMSLHDESGSRLDAAMERFSDLAQDIFAIMIGFGFLASILVFVILFLRLAWMPTHQIQRRSFFEDVLTAGVATILLGNIWIVISLFQSSFNRFWQTFAVYSKNWRTVANMVLDEFQGFIVGISGIATLVVLVMFVVNFALLALDGSNIQKRGDRVSALTMCAFAAMGLGAVTIIVGFFWNIIAI